MTITPEYHEQYEVIFRINYGSTFVTLLNAKDHPNIPKSVYEKGLKIKEEDDERDF